MEIDSIDGELTSYNGEILTIDRVEVQNSYLSAERIAVIVSELNTKYLDQNVVFVTERLAVAEYSTLYIGKTDAFSPYGSFAGVAETIDSGNAQAKTNGHPMTPKLFSIIPTFSKIPSLASPHSARIPQRLSKKHFI